MSKGIIYVMTTVVPGLIKIGKTKSDSFDSRMYNLERNGYCNVTGLKREFAIEVEDYERKEILLDEVFGKSRVPNTGLFYLDIEIVMQLLSCFDGKKVYPEKKTKQEVFEDASMEFEIKSDKSYIPDGEYFLNREVNGFGKVSGKSIVEDGVFKVLKGSICATPKHGFIPEFYKNSKISNNVLVEDVICYSPSAAGWIILGRSNNGWNEWKNIKGVKLDDFRK